MRRLGKQGRQRKISAHQGRGTAFAALEGHVSVRSSVSLQNTMVILVDDIVTTGATMRSCVKTMRKNGATVITVLALAHTPAGKQMDEPMQAQ